MSNKAMKTQVQIKNGNIESHEFIDFIVDLIGYSYIFHFSLSNTYVSDRKREHNSSGFLNEVWHRTCAPPKFLGHTFFCISKMDRNLLRLVHAQKACKWTWIKGSKMDVLQGSFAKLYLQLFFRDVNGWVLQNFQPYF